MLGTSAKRVAAGSATTNWRWMWLGLGLLLAAWPACGLGQDFVREAIEESPDDAPWFDQFSGRSGQAFGSVVGGGFVTGPGIGRDDGFAPLEFMPYFFLDDGMFLGDLRGFRSTQDKYGFNSGVGYRHYIRGWDRIIGINSFYDYDNTSGQLFRQAGIGLETYGSMWDMRLNTYFPLTDDTKQLSLEFLPDSLRYSGNNILFDQIRTFGVHMKGLDHELGIPLPGRFNENHRVKAFAGWYHFEGRDVKSVNGWKGRLQGDLTGNINMALEVTNDDVFDTNVVFSVAISYGGFKQRDGEQINQFDRMTTPIQRQYTAVVQKNPVLEADIVALKPDGTPYFVEHVASADPYNRNNVRFDPNAPLGTFENPFFTIQQAQAAPGGDIIFTWTNSQFDNMPVVTEAGVQTLGEADGVVHTFLLQPFGFVNLPRANDNPDPNVAELRPLLTFSDRNTIVDAVTLTSGIPLPDGSIIRTEFSGFRIGDLNAAQPELTGATGNGIVGDNVTGVTADFNEVNYATGDGILLTGVGDVTFFSTRVFNAGGTGLHVVGGQPRVVFEGDGVIGTPELEYDTAQFPNSPQVPGGHAVLIEGTQAGSLVDLFGSSPSEINYINAGGVLVSNANGSARFGDIQLTDTFVQNLTPPIGSTFQGAINIFNSTAAYTFAGTVNIDNPDVDAVVIERMTGQTTFQDSVTILDRQARGLNFFSNSGNILFTDTDTGISIQRSANVVGATDPALLYLASSGDVTIAGPLNLGTAGNDDGVLDVNNINNSGNGIVIGGTATDPITGLPTDDNTGTFEVRGATTIIGYQGNSLRIINDASTVRFDDFSVNERGVAAQRNNNPGVLIQEMAGDVTFTGLTSIGNTDNTVASSLDIGVALIDNSGDVRFNDLTIADANAVALSNQVAGMLVLGSPTFSPFDNTIVVGSTYTGSVFATNLNITSTNGKGLFAQFVGDIFQDPIDPSDDDETPTGGLFTDGGTIDSTFETAVQVSDSRIGLLFNTINVTQSQGAGIYLEDNIVGGRVQAFVVDPGTDVLGAGGNVIQALTTGVNTGNGQGGVLSQDRFGHGAFFQNTGTVSLRAMNFTQNQENAIFARNVLPLLVQTGVNQRDAQATLQLSVQTSQFTQNGILSVNGAATGLLAVNIPNVNIFNSLFTQNGGTVILANQTDITFPEIELRATEEIQDIDQDLDAYVFNINQITINQTLADTGDGIIVSNSQRPVFPFANPANSVFPAGPPTPLVLNLTNSIINVADPTPAFIDRGLNGLTVLWNGATGDLGLTNIFVNNNVFQNFQDTGSGINMTMLSATNGSLVEVSQNSFQINGFNTRGIVFNASGPSTSIFNLNAFNMNGVGAIATNFSLAADSGTTLSNNVVNINGDGGEGFVFSSIVAPAFVTIDNNQITINGAGGNFFEIGIDFRATTGTINFAGTNDNVIFLNGQQGTGFPWFSFPVGGNFNGSFLINGSPHP